MDRGQTKTLQPVLERRNLLRPLQAEMKVLRAEDHPLTRRQGG